MSDHDGLRGLRLRRVLAQLLTCGIFVLLACAGSAHADVYWGNFLTAFGQGEASYIGHARLDGSEANAQFLSVKKEHPARLAADARYAYAAFPSGETGHGAIGRARLDGGEPSAKFITGLSTVWGVAVSSQYIYWTNFIYGEDPISEIGRAKIDGSEVTPDFISLPPTGQAYGLALEGEYLYWSGASGIGRVKIDGEAASVDPTFIPSASGGKALAGFAWGVAADSGHIYWTHGGAIGRASITGGNVEPEFIGGIESTGTSAIAMGAGKLYWGNERGHAIARANASGAGVEQQFIPNAGDPDGIAVDRRIVVNSTADYQDATPGDGECAAKEHESMCTLRAAIEEVNAEHSTIRADVGFEIPGGRLETISLTRSLPKIESPVYLDARGQHGALLAGSRKIGAIVDGTNAGSEANGLQLTSGAAGSIVAGLQSQHFGGDGVLLEGENEQLADSVLVEDNIGAEVGANNDVVGSGEGASEKLAGDIFFRDGRPNVIGYLKGLAKKHESGEKLQLGMDVFGAAIDMTRPSSGTRVTGDYIGIHGPGFSAGADPLAEEGLTNFVEEAGTWAIGVLIAPTSAGPISNVTIGGPGEAADVDSGTIFGVWALAEDGAPINGLSIRGSSFGSNAAGEGFKSLGGFVGVWAEGSINGLEIGTAGEGDSFKGLMGGVLLEGQKLESPKIQADTFGVPSPAGSPESTFTQHDVIGVMLSDVQDASVGGAGSGQGNVFPGAFAAIAMDGEHLNHDTISHNTIGTPPANPFTTFQNVPSSYETVLGIFTTNAAPAGKGGKVAGQALSLEDNTIQNTVIGLETENVKGLQMFGNTLENDALAMVDSGSGGEQIGGPGPGQGNSFLNDGFGLLQSNENPSPTSLQQASVNPEDTKSSTKESFLNVPDEEVVYDAVDAVTTANLGPTSANTSAVPGSENAITGNRFGISAGGSPQPDELPILISGDENGLRFGGTNTGEGNIVENDRSGGLLLAGRLDHYPSVQILGNTIYNNESFTSSLPIPGLGINLVSEEGAGVLGVDPQEPIQPAAGANNLQNSPVLASASSSAGTLTLTGSLHGVPSTNYLIEVFADENPNPFGAGEGQTLLGRISVPTDAAGNVAFTATFAAPGAGYRYISSTATTVPASGPGVTSEFSVDVPITTTPTLAGTATPAGAPAPGTTATTPKGAATTTVSSGGNSATVSGSSVTLPVQVSCSSATASPCTVTTTATVPAAGASKASVTATAARGTPKGKTHKETKMPLRIGRASLTLAPGASSPLHLTLNSQGLALLHSRKSLPITLTVKITGQGRPTTTRTLHLQLKLEQPGKAKPKQGTHKHK